MLRVVGCIICVYSLWNRDGLQQTNMPILHLLCGHVLRKYAVHSGTNMLRCTLYSYLDTVDEGCSDILALVVILSKSTEKQVTEAHKSNASTSVQWSTTEHSIDCLHLGLKYSLVRH
jgi:hypothetical protein